MSYLFSRTGRVFSLAETYELFCKRATARLHCVLEMSRILFEARFFPKIAFYLYFEAFFDLKMALKKLK